MNRNGNHPFRVLFRVMLKRDGISPKTVWFIQANNQAIAFSITVIRLVELNTVSSGI